MQSAECRIGNWRRLKMGEKAGASKTSSPLTVGFEALHVTKAGLYR
jgi:hypothetical protein